MCAASIDSMMLPATFSTKVQLNLKVFPPQSSRYCLVSRRGAFKHASLGDINHGKILFQSVGGISTRFSSVTQENNRITKGRSNRKEACKHLYVVASSFGSSEDDSSSLPSEEIKIDLNLPRRRLQISFTCDACGVRSQRIINPHAYARGTVFVQCAGCEVYHKLVDNLGLIEEIDFRLEADAKAGLEEAILDNDDQTFDTL